MLVSYTCEDIQNMNLRWKVQTTVTICLPHALGKQEHQKCYYIPNKYNLKTYCGKKKPAVRDWEITDGVLIQLWGWQRLNRKMRHSSFSFFNTLSDSDKKKKYVQTLSTTLTSPRLQKQLRPLRFIAGWHLSRSGWWMELQVTSSLAELSGVFLHINVSIQLSFDVTLRSACWTEMTDWSCVLCLIQIDQLVSTIFDSVAVFEIFPIAAEEAKQIFYRWNLADMVILDWLRDCLKRGI